MTPPEKSVFVVVGSQGQYSDYREWAVCAFMDESSARAEAEGRSARLRELWSQLETMEPWSEGAKAMIEAFDPHLLSFRSTDPYDYEVWEVPLRG